MDQAQFDQMIAKLNGETSRLIDQAAKVNNRNPNVEMVIGSAVILAIVVGMAQIG